MNLSYQLYSSRGWPISQTFSMLSQIGFREVEACDRILGQPSDFRAEAGRWGLAVSSVHISVEKLETDIVGSIALAKDLGVRRVYAPYLCPEERPTDRAGWAAFAQKLATIRSCVEAAGIQFGWHNHDYDLVDLGKDWTPLDIIADAGIALELDLGWVHRAGRDPVGTIRRFGPLIKTAHIKDCANGAHNGEQEDWAEVGQGVLDWPSIHRALQDVGVAHYVVEHDNPSDHERFARSSYDFVTTL